MPAVVAVALLVLIPSAAASASTISGTAFQDLNRDAVQGLEEASLGDQQIYLFDAAGVNVAVAYTDALGRYSFADLADGDYRVAYASPSWWPLRNDWVPTTTGSLRPSISFRLSGSASADFGWRRIVRSTDAAAPISTYTGPTGLRVNSYDDVVGAREIYDAVAAARIGAEAPFTEVRFDLGSGNMTTSSALQSSGRYTDYVATSYVDYLSWVSGGDRTLTHEYGHAWSLYYAYIVQQDPAMGSYLRARGLDGDSRVNSDYAWQTREMIAEDYRQIFGSANARSGAQTNSTIPPAAAVPGLADFLSGAFTTAPAAPAPEPTPAPTPEPTAAPATTPTATPTPTATAPAPPQVTGLAMNPTQVKTTGTASFTLSAPASATVRIFSSKGVLVRSLLSGAATNAGAVAVTWDRKDSTGRRVGKGTYRLQVDVVDGDGQTATAGATFSVAG